MNGVLEFLINLFGVTFGRLFLLIFVILKSLFTPTLQETYCPDYQQYDLVSLLLQSYSLYDECFLEDFGEGFYYEGITQYSSRYLCSS